MSETGEPPEERQGGAQLPPPSWTPPPARPTTAPVAPDPAPATPGATPAYGMPYAGPYAEPLGASPQPATPRRSNTGGIATVLVVMAVLLAATLGSYLYVHDDHTSSSSTVRTAGGQQAGGSNGTAGRPSNGAGASQPGASTASPSNPYATPTPPPLDMGAVRRTMAAYLNAMQNHDLEAARSIVCPRFRSSYKGTYSPEGYAYSGWEAHYTTPVAGLNYTYVAVTQGLLDTATGAKKGSVSHSWQVQHDGDEYYVCGYVT